MRAAAEAILFAAGEPVETAKIAQALDIEIESLVQRVAEGGVKEVIFALSSTMEGDTTNFYISRKLAGYPVKLSVIARGISVGDELEYTDEVTLGRSILNRTPFGQ